MLSTVYNMTDIAKEAKKTEQDAETKLKTEKDHAEGKPSSETLKTEDALTWSDTLLFSLASQFMLYIWDIPSKS